MPTILLVDDEPETLSLFQLALAWRGYRVLLSENGAVALQIAARQMPDLIITDWNMPKMDGMEFCHRLKSFLPLAQIPVILLSARLPPPAQSRLWTEFRRKPVDLGELESTVELLLHARESLKTSRHIPTDRAASRWAPLSSKIPP